MHICLCSVKLIITPLPKPGPRWLKVNFKKESLSLYHKVSSGLVFICEVLWSTFKKALRSLLRRKKSHNVEKNTHLSSNWSPFAAKCGSSSRAVMWLIVIMVVIVRISSFYLIKSSFYLCTFDQPREIHKEPRTIKTGPKLRETTRKPELRNMLTLRHVQTNTVCEEKKISTRRSTFCL